MMRIPTSSVEKAPYIFRTGFGVELHNFDLSTQLKVFILIWNLQKDFLQDFLLYKGEIRQPKFDF